MGERRRSPRWLRVGSALSALGGLIAAGITAAVRYDTGTGAATTQLLMIAALTFLAALTVGTLVLVYTVLKSTRMTRNLVEIIKALRTKWDEPQPLSRQ